MNFKYRRIVLVSIFLFVVGGIFITTNRSFALDFSGLDPNQSDFDTAYRDAMADPDTASDWLADKNSPLFWGPDEYNAAKDEWNNRQGSEGESGGSPSETSPRSTGTSPRSTGTNIDSVPDAYKPIAETVNKEPLTNGIDWSQVDFTDTNIWNPDTHTLTLPTHNENFAGRNVDIRNDTIKLDNNNTRIETRNFDFRQDGIKTDVKLDYEYRDEDPSLPEGIDRHEHAELTQTSPDGKKAGQIQENDQVFVGGEHNRYYDKKQETTHWSGTKDNVTREITYEAKNDIPEEATGDLEIQYDITKFNDYTGVPWNGGIIPGDWELDTNAGENTNYRNVTYNTDGVATKVESDATLKASLPTQSGESLSFKANHHYVKNYDSSGRFNNTEWSDSYSVENDSGEYDKYYDNSGKTNQYTYGSDNSLISSHREQTESWLTDADNNTWSKTVSTTDVEYADNNVSKEHATYVDGQGNLLGEIINNYNYGTNGELTSQENITIFENERTKWGPYSINYQQQKSYTEYENGKIKSNQVTLYSDKEGSDPVLDVTMSDYQWDGDNFTAVKVDGYITTVDGKKNEFNYTASGITYDPAGRATVGTVEGTLNGQPISIDDLAENNILPDPNSELFEGATETTPPSEGEEGWTKLDPNNSEDASVIEDLLQEYSKEKVHVFDPAQTPADYYKSDDGKFFKMEFSDGTNKDTFIYDENYNLVERRLDLPSIGYNADVKYETTEEGKRVETADVTRKDSEGNEIKYQEVNEQSLMDTADGPKWLDTSSKVTYEQPFNNIFGAEVKIVESAWKYDSQGNIIGGVRKEYDSNGELVYDKVENGTYEDTTLVDGEVTVNLAKDTYGRVHTFKYKVKRNDGSIEELAEVGENGKPKFPLLAYDITMDGKSVKGINGAWPLVPDVNPNQSVDWKLHPQILNPQQRGAGNFMMGGGGGQPGQPGQGPGGTMPAYPTHADATNEVIDSVEEALDEFASKDFPGKVDYLEDLGTLTPEQADELRNVTVADAQRNYLEGLDLGLSDEQTNEFLGFVTAGDRDGAIDYLTNYFISLGWDPEAARARAEEIVTIIMSLTIADAWRMYLAGSNISDEEIDKFLNLTTEEAKKKWLKENTSLTDEEIEEIMGLTDEDAQVNWLKENGFNQDEIDKFLETPAEEREQYLRDELGLDDEQIEEVLGLTASDAQRAKLEQLRIETDLTDEEIENLLTDDLVEELKGLEPDEVKQRLEQEGINLNDEQIAKLLDLTVEDIQKQTLSEISRLSKEQIEEILNMDAVDQDIYLQDLVDKGVITAEQREEFLDLDVADARLDYLINEVGLPKWTAEFIVGKYRDENGELKDVDYDTRIQELLDLIKEAAEEAGLDQYFPITDTMKEKLGGGQVVDVEQQTQQSQTFQHRSGEPMSGDWHRVRDGERSSVVYDSDGDASSSVYSREPQQPQEKEPMHIKFPDEYRDEVEQISQELLKAIFSGNITPDTPVNEVAKLLVKIVEDLGLEKVEKPAMRDSIKFNIGEGGRLKPLSDLSRVNVETVNNSILTLLQIGQEGVKGTDRNLYGTTVNVLTVDGDIVTLQIDESGNVFILGDYDAGESIILKIVPRTQLRENSYTFRENGRLLEEKYGLHSWEHF